MGGEKLLWNSVGMYIFLLVVYNHTYLEKLFPLIRNSQIYSKTSFFSPPDCLLLKTIMERNPVTTPNLHFLFMNDLNINLAFFLWIFQLVKINYICTLCKCFPNIYKLSVL